MIFLLYFFHLEEKNFFGTAEQNRYFLILEKSRNYESRAAEICSCSLVSEALLFLSMSARTSCCKLARGAATRPDHGRAAVAGKTHFLSGIYFRKYANGSEISFNGQNGNPINSFKPKQHPQFLNNKNRVI